MSVRARLEGLLRERLSGVAPELAGDWWGRYRVTILFPRLAASAAGALSGEAEAVLLADTPAALPMEAVVAGLRRPLADLGAEPHLRARLTAWSEEALDMAVAARLLFTIDLIWRD